MLCSIKLGQAKPPQRATPNSHDVLIRACLMPFLRRRLLPMTSALLPLTLEQSTGAQHRWWWRPTCRRLIQIQVPHLVVRRCPGVACGPARALWPGLFWLLLQTCE